MNSRTTTVAAMRVLVVEDEPEQLEEMVRTLEAYAPNVEVQTATNGGNAWELLEPSLAEGRPLPAALVLDLMLPYGEAAQALDGDTDPDANETGVRLLEKVRTFELQTRRNAADAFVWVAVTTGRSAPDLLKRLDNLLAGHGKVYIKPFDIAEFENDLAYVLGLSSQVDPIFLPRGYQPPHGGRGGRP